ncbi:MAG: hypothetical protein VKK63_11710 [Synechococcus sp.]|nr:hypothetical protein [Synechococcus sp.]
MRRSPEPATVRVVMNRNYVFVQGEQLIYLSEALHEDAMMDAVCANRVQSGNATR